MGWGRFGIGVCSLLAPLVLTAESAEAQWRGLTIGTWAPCSQCIQYPSVALPSWKIDDMFNAANDVLWDDVDGEGEDDAFCGVGLTRQNEVGLFSNGDGDVDNEPEFWDVNDNGGHFVKVARTLTWCGRTGSFLGCTATGAKNSIVISEWAVIHWEAGITFAHEFGHSVGLADDEWAQSNVMYAWSGTEPHGIWPWQCNFYSQPVDGDGPGGFAPRTNATPRARFPQDLHQPIDFTGIDITEVARRHFIDVVPSEVADYYGPRDVEILASMLEDPSEAPHHATIAQLIGLIDGGKSEQPARTLLALTKRRTSPRQALAAAMISLGYLAHRGDRTAFSFLREHARDLRSPLIAWAIQGLGLSGRDDAKAELEQLQREADPEHARAPRAGRALRLLRQALQDNDRIRRTGLRAYYGR